MSLDVRNKVLRPLIFVSCRIQSTAVQFKILSLKINHEKSWHHYPDYRTGSNYCYRTELCNKRELDIGKLEINANKKHSLSWSPVVGVVMMTIGAGAYLTGTKKNSDRSNVVHKKISHEKYNSAEGKLD